MPDQHAADKCTRILIVPFRNFFPRSLHWVPICHKDNSFIVAGRYKSITIITKSCHFPATPTCHKSCDTHTHTHTHTSTLTLTVTCPHNKYTHILHGGKVHGCLPNEETLYSPTSKLASRPPPHSICPLTPPQHLIGRYQVT